MMIQYMAGSLDAVLIGFLLDQIFGDPNTPLHPICLIGNLITKLEGFIRRILRQGNSSTASGTGKAVGAEDERPPEAQPQGVDEDERSPEAQPQGVDGKVPSKGQQGGNHAAADSGRREIIGGAVMALLVIVVSTGIPAVLLYFCYRVSFWIGVAAEGLMCFFLLAVKSLKKESMNVKWALETEGLDAGRKAVARIVGRDTEALSETGVTKAAVETVAENFSDGVFAPLFYMMFGGAVLGFAYKSINTMDSMIGYKNEKYLYFGRFAARLDDVVNYIPSRLAALFLVVSAPLCGLDGKNAWKIWRRDRRNHASPNSAQTESAAAGALHVQLAGDAYYFGKLYKKPFIGDDDRAIETEDIARVNRLMVIASVLSLIVLCMLKAAILFL